MNGSRLLPENREVYKNPRFDVFVKYGFATIEKHHHHSKKPPVPGGFFELFIQNARRLPGLF